LANPFDWIRDVSEKKENLFDAGETDYPPFMVNRGLSYFPDSVMAASEMSRMPHLPLDMQHAYYLADLTKRRRFSRWARSAKNEDAEAVSRAYQINIRRALEVIGLLSRAQIDEIKKKNSYDESSNVRQSG